jgi:alpha-tubulin suppressor-like RCC1 family protein
MRSERTSHSARNALRAALGVVATLGIAGCDRGGGDVVQIASGGDFSCALTRRGEVWCWGDDQRALGGRDLSQLPPPQRTTPRKVPQIVDAVSIDVAASWACAVRKGGQLACFWERDFKPIDVPGVEGAAHVSLAKLHGVVDKLDGTALTFVRPDQGDATAKPIAGLTGAKRVFTGDVHGCALMKDGTVKCWGSPTSGATADAEPAPGNTPRTLKSLRDVKVLSVGRGLNCAVDAAKTVRCWGDNSFGQTGQPGTGLGGAPLGKPTPVAAVTGAVDVDAGVYHACAVLEGGAVTCWGSDEYGQLGRVQAGVAVPGLQDVTQVALGEYHSCALDKAGRVKCWGRNPRGALGNGTVLESAAPVDVAMPR